MTHLLTDEEYAQYLEEKKELEEYRYWKESLPDRIRTYFESVKNRLNEKNVDTSYPIGFLLFTGCKHEVYDRSYCDMCPVGSLFYKCPLGYMRLSTKWDSA